MFSDDTKKTIKRILFDLAIEPKKNQFTSKDISLLSNNGNEAIKNKIQSLLKIFMNPSLEKIFSTTKKSLARNKKIAKINEV